MLHVPFEQRPEQHSLLAAQALPAVVHDEDPVAVPPSPPVAPPPPIGAHFPPAQVFVQHSLPATGQLAPTVTHCAALHAPLTQAPVQQSVLTAHAAPPPAHAPIDETH
jgi:hypothetical protein